MLDVRGIYAYAIALENTNSSTIEDDVESDVSASTYGLCVAFADTFGLYCMDGSSLIDEI